MSDDTSNEPQVYGPEARLPDLNTVPLDTSIWRYTDNTDKGMVRAPMPCCPDFAVTVDPEVREYIAACRSCGDVFKLLVIDEGDGGYAALFTVIGPHVRSTRTRKPRTP